MDTLKIFFLACSLAIVSVCWAAYDIPIHPMDGIYQAPRIIYGYLAKEGQFPYQAFIFIQSASGYSSCGGSVIARSYILTASHCTKGVISATVTLGSINRGNPYLQLTSNIFYTHEEYNPTTLNNDIGVVKLPIELEYNEHISPIRLPTLGQRSATFESAVAYVSGFGRYSISIIHSSQELRWVLVRVVSNAQCALNFGSHIVIDSTICVVGYAFDEQGMCHGDSGGPLAIREGNSWTQIGVISFLSQKGCGTERPSGCTRTSHFIEWVQQKAGVAIRMA